MADREKLVALLESDDCPLLYVLGENMGTLADHLLANGVVVREKGEWEIHGQVDTMFYCSKCKLNVSGFEKRWLNFCPNCGADMRKGENG